MKKEMCPHRDPDAYTLSHKLSYGKWNIFNENEVVCEECPHLHLATGWGLRPR